jgi:hypothetical protein
MKKTTNSEAQLLSIHDAAKRIGLTYSGLLARVNRGQIPATKRKHRFFIKASDAEKAAGYILRPQRETSPATNVINLIERRRMASESVRLLREHGPNPIVLVENLPATHDEAYALVRDYQKMRSTVVFFLHEEKLQDVRHVLSWTGDDEESFLQAFRRSMVEADERTRLEVSKVRESAQDQRKAADDLIAQKEVVIKERDQEILRGKTTHETDMKALRKMAEDLNMTREMLLEMEKAETARKTKAQETTGTSGATESVADAAPAGASG